MHEHVVIDTVRNLTWRTTGNVAISLFFGVVNCILWLFVLMCGICMLFYNGSVHFFILVTFPTTSIISQNFAGSGTWLEMKAVGYSGVLFSYAVIESYSVNVQSRSLFGLFNVPAVVYPWWWFLFHMKLFTKLSLSLLHFLYIIYVLKIFCSCPTIWANVNFALLKGCFWFYSVSSCPMFLLLDISVAFLLEY